MKEDMVNHPKHYNMYSFEVIDLIKEVVKFFPIEIVYQIGNALKYILRSPFKGNLIQDLEKAVYYLNDSINTLKEGKEND